MALFASSLSQHPNSIEATGEVIGTILESINTKISLALIFVTQVHKQDLQVIADTVKSVLEPDHILGSVCESVISNETISNEIKIKQEPAMVLWVTTLEDQISSFDINTEDELRSILEKQDLPGDFFLDSKKTSDLKSKSLILISDSNFEIKDLFDYLNSAHLAIPVMGGIVSKTNVLEKNLFYINGKIKTSGAIGVLLGSKAKIKTIISQSCRPIGQPMTITKSKNNTIYEMAGKTALEKLREIAKNTFTPKDLELLNSIGLVLGRVINEHEVEFNSQDFLIRDVVDLDMEKGSITTDEAMPIGTTVQFHLHDIQTPDYDLEILLGNCEAKSVLLFTSKIRGMQMFKIPDHTIKALARSCNNAPMAGFFTSGEFSPVGRGNFVHEFSTSIVIFS